MLLNSSPNTPISQTGITRKVVREMQNYGKISKIK